PKFLEMHMARNNVDIRIADCDKRFVEIGLFADLAGGAQQAAVRCALEAALDRIGTHSNALLLLRRRWRSQANGDLVMIIARTRGLGCAFMLSIERQCSRPHCGRGCCLLRQRYQEPSLVPGSSIGRCALALALALAPALAFVA